MMSQQLSHDYEGYSTLRPTIYIGQHDSSRTDVLTDRQYGHLLDHGVRRPARPSACVLPLRPL